MFCIFIWDLKRQNPCYSKHEIYEATNSCKTTDVAVSDWSKNKNNLHFLKINIVNKLYLGKTYKIHND